ncbi:MAG: twin-arginine translocation signal domain-containing protein, partial [Planctomycetes bacterium]|nr:twin-arginine translocation signal domain-containing protein [Planctomycetota bacterium]
MDNINRRSFLRQTGLMAAALTLPSSSILA